VKEMAPWEWMMEDQVFGVQHPDTGELGFVSVMGNLGEHLAIALYLGAEGLYGLFTMEECEEEDIAWVLYTIPQLQLSFGNRDCVDTRERKLMDALNLKFRGRQSWPKFRSFQPGCLPWYLEASEAGFLLVALEQLLDVAPRLLHDDGFLEMEDEETFLVRVGSHQNGDVLWEDREMRVAPPEIVLRALWDSELLNKLAALPRVGNRLEVDFFLMPTPIQESQALRPYLPHCLFIVEQESGLIMGQDMLDPFPSLNNMREKAPLRFADILVRLEVLPEVLYVRAGWFADFLAALFRDVPCNVIPSKRLRSLDTAKEEFIGFLSGGSF